MIGGVWFDSDRCEVPGDSAAILRPYTREQIAADGTRVSFRLHDPGDVPYPDKFVGMPGYRCGDQTALPPSLSGRAVLNFTTTVATDLKVVFVGDSLGEQFAQAFDAAVLGVGHDDKRLARTYRNGRDNINLHSCLSVSAPVRGGGVSAFWRVATLMSMETRGAGMCAHKTTTWNEQQGATLVHHRYFERAKNESDRRHVRPAPEWNASSISTRDLPHAVGAFDAAVLRLPHGWLTIKQITKERIIEAIHLTNKNLGVQTVIVSTLPLNNNVITPADWEGVARINQIVRDLAAGWAPPRQLGGVTRVLVQEFGNFTNQVVRMNAEHIKLVHTATPDFAQMGWELAGTEFLLQRLTSDHFWVPSAAMVCASPPRTRRQEDGKEAEECVRNRISRDGCHWCVETLGARYSASVACLLGCVFNTEPGGETANGEGVRRCERVCNDRFMSILPVEKEWIGSNMALSSKSF